jgi:large conductance mechanosensitive channel
MGLVKEFRDFAVKGNAIDMAVGIVIGGAFGKIVTSLVQDVLMPPIGLVLRGVDFSSLAVVLKGARSDPATGTVLEPAVLLGYGPFVNTVVNFFIVALALFAVVKVVNRVRGAAESVLARPSAKTGG